jgi:hypothetical protein
MKRLILGSLISGLLIINLPAADAGWWGTNKQEPAKTAPATQAGEKKAAPVAAAPAAVKKVDNKTQLEAINARKALIDKKRAELNNTEWILELIPVTATAKSKKEAETLVFRNNQISVSGYIGLNFSSTNYTLSPQPNGSVIWETMQTSEKSPNTVVFWRGEISADTLVMKGMLSYHVDEKTTKDFSFVAISKKSLVPAPAQ